MAKLPAFTRFRPFAESFAIYRAFLVPADFRGAVLPAVGLRTAAFALEALRAGVRPVAACLRPVDPARCLEVLDLAGAFLRAGAFRVVALFVVAFFLPVDFTNLSAALAAFAGEAPVCFTMFAATFCFRRSCAAVVAFFRAIYATSLTISVAIAHSP